MWIDIRFDFLYSMPVQKWKPTSSLERQTSAKQQCFLSFVANYRSNLYFYRFPIQKM